jgi:hypothetical protein
MANLLSENLLYTTVCVEDDVGSIVGTGFLVGDTAVTTGEWGQPVISWERPQSRAYLVTARHVLGANESEIGSTIAYGLRYNSVGPSGLLLAHREFLIENDPRNWAVHPDPHVDVAALDVTHWISTAADGHFRFCPLSEVANAVNLAQAECDAGDDAYVLGYPLTLRQGATNLPLVRKGVLATSPRRPLQEADGSLVRGFLIDGAILPGSSGSPVISTSGRFIAGDLDVTPSRPLVLGVVAQEWGRGELARYDAGRHSNGITQIEGYANLGFAHSGSAIIQTIMRFGHHDDQDFLRLDHDFYWAAQTGIPEWTLDLTDAVDGSTVDRIMRRLHRDRMRGRGYSVPESRFHDASEIMGPVPASAVKEMGTGLG